MNLDTAIQKHMEWKVKFRSAITKQDQMDVATIGKDNCCDLGKWLYGEGKTQCGSLGSYPTVISKHAAFHVEAAKIATAINEKNYTEAEAMLGTHSPFSTVSGEVGIAIMRLKKEAA